MDKCMHISGGLACRRASSPAAVWRAAAQCSAQMEEGAIRLIPLK